MSKDTETTEEKCRRELDDLEYLRSCVDAKLRRIDARIADLRQQAQGRCQMSEDTDVEVTEDETTEVTEEVVEWGEYTGYVYEWIIPAYGVQLWLRTVPGACDRFKQRWAYHLSWQGEVLFEGEDLKCPEWLGPKNVVETCMGFLTTQYRDEDDEPYTQRQLEWFQHWHCDATALEADLLVGGEA